MNSLSKETCKKYGIITAPVIESKIVDNTPLGKSENPKITISNPEKVDPGFFSSNYITYVISTSPLNIQIKRKYYDFEWLRDKIVKLYPGNIIPEIAKKPSYFQDVLENTFVEKRMKKFEKFLNFLLLDPIIKNSQILYDFISVSKEEDFAKKKKIYDGMNPPQTIYEYQTILGEAKIEFDKTGENYFNTVKNNLSSKDKIFYKIKENIKLLKAKIDDITLKIEEIAGNYSELMKICTNELDGEKVISTYSCMNRLFINWSNSLKSNFDIVSNGSNQYHKYLKKNCQSIKDFIYLVDTNQKPYKKAEGNLISQKDEFVRKGYMNKSEIERDAILSKILEKETNSVINLRTIYGFYLNKFIDEIERIKSINSTLHKENYKDLCEKIKIVNNKFQNYISSSQSY